MTPLSHISQKLILDRLKFTSDDDFQVAKEYGLEPVEIEGIMESQSWYKCPQCNTWRELGDLQDELGEMAGCKECR